jgi:hypothetical protein
VIAAVSAFFAVVMAGHVDAHTVQTFLPAVVVLLKNVADSLVETEEVLATSAGDSRPQSRVTRVHDALVHMNTIVAAMLHDFRLGHARSILNEELGFWVLPRSTAWFSHFLLSQIR